MGNKEGFVTFDNWSWLYVEIKPDKFKCVAAMEKDNENVTLIK
jgi:hypothetical protein